MTTEWTPSDFLTGRDREKDVIELTAGPVKLVFDPNIGFLRQARIGDHELIRGIYMAVRNKAWKTLPIDLTITSSLIENNHFKLEFFCKNKLNEAEFHWNGVIEGDANGKVTYGFSGEAQSEFERMRLGLCLLHAENECSGKPLHVTHSDGSIEETRFATSVAPIAPEPVIDITGLKYPAALGVDVSFSFEGDTFEMEDQRNWTDASFKTYCTPARLPRPVLVKKGDKVSQSITMELNGDTGKIFPILIGRDPQFNISTTPVLMIPPIGTNVCPDATELSTAQVELLSKLKLSHLRADILPENERWKSHLTSLASQSKALGLPVHLAISEGNPTPELLKEIKTECDNLGIAPVVVQMIGMKGKVLDEETIESIKPALTELFPGASCGVGSDKDFAQVNASRHLSKSQLHPVYGICPQVHAFDNLTLVENLSCQSKGVECLQEWWSQTPMVASIHLHRYPGARALYDKDAAAKEWDSRHPSLFAAAWTLGSMAKLIESGNVQSITYYETAGVRGLLAHEDAESHQMPDCFSHIPGAPYPLYFIFQTIASHTRAMKTLSSHPWETLGLTLLDQKNKRTILIANMLNRDLPLKVKSGSCSGHLKSLDQSNVIDIMQNPGQWESSKGEAIEARGGKLHLDLSAHAIAVFQED